MTNETKNQERTPSVETPGFHRRLVHAERTKTPHACGCGLPVAFDPERHEFFCIGCGSSKLCTCRRSPFGSPPRPVNVL